MNGEGKTIEECFLKTLLLKFIKHLQTGNFQLI